jgi:hypothetical protein
VEVARLLKAARLIEAETPLGRQLLNSWQRIDADHPDPTSYAQLVAALEPAEIDYQAAFRSLTDREDDHG